METGQSPKKDLEQKEKDLINSQESAVEGLSFVLDSVEVIQKDGTKIKCVEGSDFS